MRSRGGASELTSSAHRLMADEGRPMARNQEQLDALSSAVILANAGVGFTVDDKARVVCDGLVKTGHLVSVVGVAGGYMPSEELAKAMLINTAQKTEQAKGQLRPCDVAYSDSPAASRASFGSR